MLANALQCVILQVWLPWRRHLDPICLQKRMCRSATGYRLLTSSGFRALRIHFYFWVEVTFCQSSPQPVTGSDGDMGPGNFCPTWGSFHGRPLLQSFLVRLADCPVCMVVWGSPLHNSASCLPCFIFPRCLCPLNKLLVPLTPSQYLFPGGYNWLTLERKETKHHNMKKHTQEPGKLSN